MLLNRDVDKRDKMRYAGKLAHRTYAPAPQESAAGAGAWQEGG